MKDLELNDIVQEIYESTQRVKQGSKKGFTYAFKKADSERNYRKALGQEIMRLKDEKFPVTLIPDVARGLLADLKFERDLAEAEYTSYRETLDAIKTQMNGLQTIVKIQKDIEGIDD